MCLNLVSYWPVQPVPGIDGEFSLCSPVAYINKTRITACGASGKKVGVLLFPLQNPINDTVGAPTTFGESVDTCPTQGPITDPTPSVTPLISTRIESPTSTPIGSLTSTPIDAPASTGTAIASTATTPSSTPSSSVNSAPNALASASPDEEDDSVCFPGSATVQLVGGLAKRMEEVEIGDVVQVGANIFSKVFAFTHRSRESIYVRASSN